MGLLVTLHNWREDLNQTPDQTSKKSRNALKLQVFQVFQLFQDCEIWLKLWNLAEIVKFGQNCEIFPKLWNLATVVKYSFSCLNSFKSWNYESPTQRPDPLLEMLAHLKMASVGRRYASSNFPVKLSDYVVLQDIEWWTLPRILTEICWRVSGTFVLGSRQWTGNRAGRWDLRPPGNRGIHTKAHP